MIDDDWQEIQGMTAAQPTSKPLDLQEDWAAVRNIPPTFYHVVKGVGFDYMAILKLKCFGAVQRPPRMGGPAYRGVVEEYVWRGKSYTTRVEDSTTQHAYTQKTCDTSLEDALERFEEYRRGFQVAQEDSIRRTRAEAETLILRASQMEADAAKMASFDIRRVLAKTDTDFRSV